MDGLEDLGKVIETDVLVIGAGVAGLFSAIRARAFVDRVTLVDKGPIGKTSQCYWALGGHQALLPEDSLDDTLEQVVGRLLERKGMTLAVAESCTGGLLAQRITSIPGSSGYFVRGVVSYSNAAKTGYLGVEPKLIESHGAVSEEVARAMAVGVKDGAAGGEPVDIGIAITGIAGPTGGSEQKPTGTVFVALAHEDGGVDTVTECKNYRFYGDRDRVRLISSQVALEWIRRYVLSKSELSGNT